MCEKLERNKSIASGFWARKWGLTHAGSHGSAIIPVSQGFICEIENNKQKQKHLELTVFWGGSAGSGAFRAGLGPAAPDRRNTGHIRRRAGSGAPPRRADLQTCADPQPTRGRDEHWHRCQPEEQPDLGNRRRRHGAPTIIVFEGGGWSWMRLYRWIYREAGC